MSSKVEPAIWLSDTVFYVTLWSVTVEVMFTSYLKTAREGFTAKFQTEG